LICDGPGSRKHAIGINTHGCSTFDFHHTLPLVEERAGLAGRNQTIVCKQSVVGVIHPDTYREVAAPEAKVTRITDLNVVRGAIEIQRLAEFTLNFGA
jgi:hypothetical protein